MRATGHARRSITALIGSAAAERAARERAGGAKVSWAAAGLVSALTVAIATPAAAQYYSCTGPDKKVRYQDSPCPATSAQRVIEHKPAMRNTASEPSESPIMRQGRELERREAMEKHAREEAQRRHEEARQREEDRKAARLQQELQQEQLRMLQREREILAREREALRNTALRPGTTCVVTGNVVRCE